jgi:hypothetical protein
MIHPCKCTAGGNGGQQCYNCLVGGMLIKYHHDPLTFPIFLLSGAYVAAALIISTGCVFLLIWALTNI